MVSFATYKTAFDCVNHKLFILVFYGITGNHYKLYKFHLTNRYQRILLYNEHDKLSSTWAKFEHGVPQGLELGPLFFRIYVVHKRLTYVCKR